MLGWLLPHGPYTLLFFFFFPWERPRRSSFPFRPPSDSPFSLESGFFWRFLFPSLSVSSPASLPLPPPAGNWMPFFLPCVFLFFFSPLKLSLLPKRQASPPFPLAECRLPFPRSPPRFRVLVPPFLFHARTFSFPILIRDPPVLDFFAASLILFPRDGSSPLSPRRRQDTPSWGLFHRCHRAFYPAACLELFFFLTVQFFRPNPHPPVSFGITFPPFPLEGWWNGVTGSTGSLA